MKDFKVYDDIARQISQASKNRRKSAMFHYQVLVNADKLAEEDPVNFCRAVGMNESYATEFRKMLQLSRLIKQMGKTIS